MTDYDRWNRAIAVEFFSADYDGRPAPLAVDVASLRQVAKRLEIRSDEALK